MAKMREWKIRKSNQWLEKAGLKDNTNPPVMAARLQALSTGATELPPSSSSRPRAIHLSLSIYIQNYRSSAFPSSFKPLCGKHSRVASNLISWLFFGWLNTHPRQIGAQLTTFFCNGEEICVVANSRTHCCSEERLLNTAVSDWAEPAMAFSETKRREEPVTNVTHDRAFRSAS